MSKYGNWDRESLLAELKHKDLEGWLRGVRLERMTKLVEFADKELKGDYNWEMAKNEAGIPSEIDR